MRRRGEKESLTADGLWFTGCSGAKKAIEETPKEKGGFLKKAPFQSRKNFSATDAKLSLCAPN